MPVIISYLAALFGFLHRLVYRLMFCRILWGAIIDCKDQESGNTALHRALFYGCIDCAALLIRYGANFELTDNDFRNPLQHICKPQQLEYLPKNPQSNEILVWGTNKNYNLGLGNDQGSLKPQSIDMFRKELISIQQVAIGAYHSLFIDSSGSVYSVGHGKGGRIGTGNETTLPLPKRLKLPTRDSKEFAICISVSKNHSLVLTNKGSVYTCGINTDQQLGLKPAPEMCVVLKEVTAFKQYGVVDLKGVIAKDFHSLAFNEKDVYVWGANNGQFGIKEELAHVLLPRQLYLPEKRKLQLVESSNTAIVCYTSCKQILLYHNFKVRTLKTPR